MDGTAMTYPDSVFDIVIDKSTIDALLCSDCPYINTARMLEEVERVLKPDGVYFIISYAEPIYRMQHFTQPHVSL